MTERLDPEPVRRPRILVTNDDGIESRGIAALAAALRELGEVVVIAPDRNQSAVGHARTLWRPLRIRERQLVDGTPGWSVDGSPSDAVSLAFLGFVPGPFDLVAAGINHGANVGDDITYSGTVSAAMEGVINGCPSMAVSHEDYAAADFRLASAAAVTVARAILARGLEPGQLLNVNVPAVAPEACGGIEVTRLGKRIYQDELIRREDPWGVPYYWFGGLPPTGEAIPGTDLAALVNRRVSVTPIHLDLTAERFLERLRGWELTLGE
jgi:5'-nucleotidase